MQNDKLLCMSKLWIIGRACPAFSFVTEIVLPLSDFLSYCWLLFHQVCLYPCQLASFDLPFVPCSYRIKLVDALND